MVLAVVVVVPVRDEREEVVGSVPKGRKNNESEGDRVKEDKNEMGSAQRRERETETNINE